MKPNKIIVVGGGQSIQKIIPFGLWDTLSTAFTIGCNFSYKDFTPTALCCIDGDFYSGFIDFDEQVKLWNKFNPKHRENLSNLPLIIALNTIKSLENPLPNTVFIKGHSHTWFRDKSVLKGFYCHSLTGHLALSLACFLLNFSGEIYLIGFDSNKSGNSHYYNHSNHRGIGYLDHYKTHNINDYLQPYLEEKDLQIFNVSDISEITIFKKITPETFMERIRGNNYNQDELREMIRQKLTN